MPVCEIDTSTVKCIVKDLLLEYSDSDCNSEKKNSSASNAECGVAGGAVSRIKKEKYYIIIQLGVPLARAS